ncbi:MAG: PKD domain-containing protein [Desulfobulbales bacterium]|nr:PKD domain-containing protein [Desulfobulbales bacterium]
MQKTSRISFALCVPFFALLLFGCGGGGGYFNLQIADAGSDQIVRAGDQVTLDGSASKVGIGGGTSPGTMLTYNWSFTLKPAGSTAALYDQTAMNPTFTADRAGTYTVCLTVSDGSGNSADDSVTIIATEIVANSAPVAVAGPDRTVTFGMSVELDGGGSYDADGDPLTYKWNVIEKPGPGFGEPESLLLSEAEGKTTLNPDAVGAYTIQLVVNDGMVDSAADIIVVTAATPAPPVFINGDPPGIGNHRMLYHGRIRYAHPRLDDYR